MVLVRPTVITAALTGTFPARPALPLFGMQIVSRGNVHWAEKAAWFRNVPYTAVYPHDGQIEARIRFGELAREAKARGEINKVSKRLGKWLPGAAAYIADNMAGYRAPSAMPKEQWPSTTKRTLRTLEELKSMYEARIAGRAR